MFEQFFSASVSIYTGLLVSPPTWVLYWVAAFDIESGFFIPQVRSECCRYPSVSVLGSEVKAVPTAPRPKTVLVVEDDTDFRRMTKAILDRQGHTVFTAADVSEAEELWAMARNNIDVVVSDNVLGFDLGVDLVERFRSQEPHGHFVLFSGLPVQMEVPGVSFLMKPFTVSAILEQVA